MAEVTLNEHEQECLLFLTERWHAGEKRVDLRTFPRYGELGQDTIIEVIDRFENFGWLDWESNIHLAIRAKAVEDAHRLEHPPAKDYWKDLTVWFRSKRWSILILLALVVPPFLKAWFDLVRGVLDWFR